MKNRRDFIEVDGQKVFMDHFYQQYDQSKSLSVCSSMDNKVLSIENVSENSYADIEILDGPTITIAPGARASFGSLRFSKEDMKFFFRTKKMFNYEDDH